MGEKSGEEGKLLQAVGDAGIKGAMRIVQFLSEEQAIFEWCLGCHRSGMAG